MPYPIIEKYLYTKNYVALEQQLKTVTRTGA